MVSVWPPSSGSTGVGRSDKGRFTKVGFRGVCVGTGEGESIGSFSFDADSSLSSSLAESSSFCICGFNIGGDGITAIR